MRHWAEHFEEERKTFGDPTDTFVPPEYRVGYEIVDEPVEVDDDLGLELVPEKPTMEQFYNLGTVKDNSFTRSLREQYDARGSLSEKQIACLRR